MHEYGRCFTITLCIYHLLVVTNITPHYTFYLHGSTLILAWMDNYIHYKVLDEITNPFSNFSGCTFEVREWISNSRLNWTYNSLSMLRFKFNHVDKMGPGSVLYMYDLAHHKLLEGNGRTISTVTIVKVWNKYFNPPLELYIFRIGGRSDGMCVVENGRSSVQSSDNSLKMAKVYMPLMISWTKIIHPKKYSRIWLYNDKVVVSHLTCG